MKKILGLIASQRKLGNGEILVKEVAAATGENHQLELLRLADLELKFCRGCYTCINPGKQCPLDDGLYYLVEKMKAADGIILSAPCYALGPSAVTKVLGDRIIALAQLIDELWDKPCVVIGTTGVEGWDGYTSSALNTIARFMGFAVKDSHIFIGALPGEGIIAEGALARAHEMGQALFGKARQPKEGECPTCWSEAWKLVSSEKVVCSTCGQIANLSFGEEGIRWDYVGFGTMFEKENLKSHFQQRLPSMVQEFLFRRKEFAEIRNRYKSNDIWLTPRLK